MSQKITADAARRIALSAHGFARRRTATPGPRQFASVIDSLGALQIDSVNVFERSHYLPVFARLGAYDKSALDALTHRSPARVTEWWAHEATFLRTGDLPLWGWKMRMLRERDLADDSSWANAHAAELDWVRRELAARGPSLAREIETDVDRARGSWWDWSTVKHALEMLFRWGEVAIAGRTSTFERRYALAEQVLPDHVRATEISRDDAVRELVRRAARATGIATASDLSDYYRLPVEFTTQAIRELHDEGELTHVHVDGWTRGSRALDVWMPTGQVRPRAVSADALLSPFDPVVWSRPRAERLFDFRYRIEIYTPRHKRVYGYYVLPVLIGDRLAARVDLKSDRKAGVLRVQSAWAEPHAPADTVERLSQVVRAAAQWQEHDSISVGSRGDLSNAVAHTLGASRHETP
ncbi:winged helix-turn-helix domain-containing protein [Paramicrobacterium fandaimingii]|uniref:winged helix-turn-helix domain-containing protein n=1 Tax=Paramicrobacterium fandaimingii TaxID=2708079 RepID=UPI001422BC3C|nr:crosslink repair DNA glycosylase YcaQ family protein [Microbacterium fandaimingii]